MDTIDIYLSLDFREGRALKTVNLIQGDRLGSKAIYLTLTNGGDPVTLVSGADTATLQAGTDSTILITEQRCAISAGRVRIDVSEALTSVPGIVHCTVEISSGSGIAHTALFDVCVWRSPIDDGKPEIISTDSLQQRVTQLEQQSQDVSRFESRITALERSVPAIENTLSDMSDTLEEHEERITALEQSGGGGGTSSPSGGLWVSDEE